MKLIIALSGLAVLLGTAGCEIEDHHHHGHGGYYGGYNGEYPYGYYGHGERYHDYRPYDRDHYWHRDDDDYWHG